MTWWGRSLEVLEWKLKLGNVEFSILNCIEFFILVGIVFLSASLVRRLFRLHILSRTGISPTVQDALARFTGYLVIVIGLFVSLQIMGIHLANLAFLVGALGLGLGFGLQNIISNFVSGFIILIERPIQVGDRIEVSGLEGDVVEINARSTKIVTNNNITIIVPNSEFISSRVVNWSHGDLKVRIPIPVGVAYNSDPQLVKRALLEVAAELPDVMKHPPPGVRFMSFGDSSLNFELRVWTETQVQHKFRLISDVNFRIFEKFQKYGIEIPFPQQDLHIKSIVSPTAAPPLSAPLAAAAHLRKNRLFEALSDDDIARLAEKGVSRRFYPRQTIIRQGDAGDSLFIILQGIAEVEIQKSGHAASARITTLGRGDFFGEMSMLTGENRSATIIADSPVEVFELRKDSLQPILLKTPFLAEELSRVLAEHQAQDKAYAEEDGQISRTTGAQARPENIPGLLGRIRLFFKLS